MIPRYELLRRAMAGGCAIALMLTGCKKSEAGGAAAEGEATKPTVTATTAVASVEPFTHAIPAIGEVVARPGRFAALSAPAPTRISKVYVSAGQRVAAGAPLVEFEQMGFNAAATGAQAALTAAQRNYERAERLSREGIVPRKDVEQATADLAAARAAAVTARREQQLSVLRSPIAGVVTSMSAVLGASADAGQTLVEVADPSAFDAALSLGPAESGDVHSGARVVLSAGEKAGGESLGAGTVASVAATVDSTARSVAIRVRLKTPRRTLKLGESVYGEIAVETRANAVVVPVEALVPEGEGYKVFVVDKSGTAISREVKIGGRTATKVEILEGLSGGETVVTQGAYGLEDSVKVVRPEPAKP
ncbi:MAG: efflux RND transporter periplasmic adaptor subunit [bacterium]